MRSTRAGARVGLPEGGPVRRGPAGFYMGHYSEAREYLEESLAIALRDRGRHRESTPAVRHGMLGQGESRRSAHHLEEAVSMARELGIDVNLLPRSMRWRSFLEQRGDRRGGAPL